MSFSPRPRPHTVNLDFHDPDLTDTYRDEDSLSVSSPAISRQSGRRRRHPRGDTPLSAARERGQQSEGSSTGRSAYSSSTIQKSNLDRLLDFLDDEDEREAQVERITNGTLTPEKEWHQNRSIATSTPPPTLPSSSRPPPPPTTVRRISSTSTASLHRTNAVREDTVTMSTNATESPTMRAALSTSYRISRSDSPHLIPSTDPAKSYQHSHVSAVSNGRGLLDDLPDSPSPRPGSVAAMRNGERSGFMEGSSTHSRLREQSSTTEAAERDRRQDGQGTEEEDTEEERDNGSVDSITRVAEAALREFDTIVSHGTSPSLRSDRPPSRLRNIPSPTRSLSPTTLEPASEVASESTATLRQNGFEAETSIDPNQINRQLLTELRDAQDYISYLQDELRSISDVVVQLQVPDDLQSIPDGAHPSVRNDPSLADKNVQAPVDPIEATSQAAFDVVKHLVALLPNSLSLASSTNPNSSPPTTDSLALAIHFTRSIDTLTHGGRRRRDEDVFTEDNLQSIEGRVIDWARGAGNVRGVTRIV